MKAYLHKISKWLIPPFAREEKLTTFERLLILWLLLLGMGLFLFLTGILSIRLSWLPLQYHAGFYCPGCGGTRALGHLLQGQLLMAWRYNPLFILLLPLLMYGGLNLLRSLVTGYPLTRINISPAWLWSLLAFILLFTVLRNIPVPALNFLRPPG